MQDRAVILCVDDDPKMLNLLKYILEGTGHQVLTTTDGGQALDLAQSGGIDLVLLDVGMPAKSGIEVLEGLKACDGDIHIIMVSGVDDLKTTLDAVGKGAHDYVCKPINANQLLSRVKQALELRRVTH